MLTGGTNMLLTSGNVAERIVLVSPCKLISLALVDLCLFFSTISSGVLLHWLVVTEEEGLSQKFCFLQNEARAAASPAPDKPC